MSSSARDKKLIVAFLSKNTPKTVAEIANEMSLNEKTTEDLVASLVNDEEGRVLEWGKGDSFAPKGFGMT